MARVSEQEIERIKAEISVERLAESSGVELKRHGKDLLGRCPFHDDKTPSLVITPAKNLWHCLGACQTGGSVIDWVMKREGVSFRHAVELLQDQHPSLLAADQSPAGAARKPPKKATTRKLAGVLETGMSDDVLMERVVSFYEKTLQESPEGLAYLEKRGLKHAELLKTFRLGFANRTLGYRLPAKNRKEGAALREQLQAVGILRESGHEHFNGSIVIPVFDEQGRVVEMYGRKVGDKLRKGTPHHLYLPGPHRGVFNTHAFFVSKELILCESLMDALTFWCAGFRNVTCSYGIEGFTDELREAMKTHGTEKVMIAYDRDEAGDKAADKLASELTAMGIEAWRVKFPKGMDTNEYALKVGPAEKSLGAALRSAEWLGKGAPPPSEEGLVQVEQVTTQPPEPQQPSRDGEATKEEVLEESEQEAESSGAPIPSLVASEPRPEASEKSSSPVDARADELSFTLGNRRYRVRGLSKNQNPAALKINLLVQHTEDGTIHVDTLELYSARQRQAYIKQAAEELETEERIIKRDLGKLLLLLEEHQQKAQDGAGEHESPAPQMSEAEREEALKLLRDPRLLDRILEDFDACGVVGERTNKLTGYLAATSRKLERPLAIVVQSSSAAGKSSLMDAVLQLMPEEERVSYSAMTGQSLFYMGETNLGHKILAIAEEEGAERASYALKLLQSEGELTIASTGKDPTTGRLITQEYRVEGPVMIFLTTTAIEVDEELLNRCLVLSVDENREQTSAIHERQRQAKTLEGLLQSQEKQRLIKLHQNAQRLIRPLHVVNSYAAQLTFPDHQTRLRRDHGKYLSLIDTVALLHQHQRPVKTVQHRGQALEYIEVEPQDIAIANKLAHEVLGRTLDELPPQTRRLLGQLDELVTRECDRQGVDRSDFRFSRRDVRERTSWGDTQLKIHLTRLVELELLLVHRGRQGQGYQYELCFAGTQGDGPFLPGLIDADELKRARGTTPTSRGSGGDFAGGGRPLVGGKSGASRSAETDVSPQKTSGESKSRKAPARKPHPGSKKVNGESQSHPSLLVAGAGAPTAAE